MSQSKQNLFFFIVKNTIPHFISIDFGVNYNLTCFHVSFNLYSTFKMKETYFVIKIKSPEGGNKYREIFL